jgi:uncharacterized protein (DUF111 family)
LVPETVGYGAGTREWTDFPNLLRAVLVSTEKKQVGAAWPEEQVTVLTANVDDATPQLLGYVMECLLAAGALDVSYQALQMKKNRPGHRLEVMARLEDAQRLAELIFRETPTLGLRVETPRRWALPRTERTVRVLGHPIRLKIAHGAKGVVTVTPEYEDVKACAHAEHQTWRAIAHKAMTQAKEIL